jgi:hypothetical protein
MAPVHIILSVLLLVCLSMGAYWSILNYRRHKANMLVASELDSIIASTLETIKGSKKTIAKQKNGAAVTELGESPELMSTIITVLINKFGNVHLSIDDFMIADHEYVSVYVDTKTQEIILSIDHSLSLTNPYVSYPNPDDGTFH